jgi:hypothetical protein
LSQSGTDCRSLRGARFHPHKVIIADLEGEPLSLSDKRFD